MGIRKFQLFWHRLPVRLDTQGSLFQLLWYQPVETDRHKDNIRDVLEEDQKYYWEITGDD
jgi:hypothetical protein